MHRVRTVAEGRSAVSVVEEGGGFGERGWLVRGYCVAVSSDLIDMSQKWSRLPGGFRISATVPGYLSYAMWVQLCSPSARSSTMVAWA
ncbi:hypothetical protein [Streptomyces sp. NPDC056628]|uniref:hypothetical protein n=1 Tax=Streptomyces sp. NPDC056628 TaxID=3345882 RepID=UPI0036C09DCF